MLLNVGEAGHYIGTGRGYFVLFIDNVEYPLIYHELWQNTA